MDRYFVQAGRVSSGQFDDKREWNVTQLYVNPTGRTAERDIEGVVPTSIRCTVEVAQFAQKHGPFLADLKMVSGGAMGKTIFTCVGLRVVGNPSDYKIPESPRPAKVGASVGVVDEPALQRAGFALPKLMVLIAALCVAFLAAANVRAARPAGFDDPITIDLTDAAVGAGFPTEIVAMWDDNENDFGAYVWEGGGYTVMFTPQEVDGVGEWDLTFQHVAFNNLLFTTAQGAGDGSWSAWEGAGAGGLSAPEPGAAGLLSPLIASICSRPRRCYLS